MVLREPLRGSRAERLHAFVSLAFHEPRVRALWLHTSHFLLTFSTGPGWPHTGDLPVVDPVGTTGQYVVRTRDRQIHPETDAAGALRLLLAALS